MKSEIFNKTPAQNKVLAAHYVCKAIQGQSQGAEVVRNIPTGGEKNMRAGVQAAAYGLIHITCGSSTDPNQKIWGWDAHGLSQCVDIDHVAFVWSDQQHHIHISILTKQQTLMLAEKNKGQYAKQELVKHAVKNFDPIPA